MFVGDIYISDNDFYIVLQNLTNRSGTELAGNINGIEQLVNQVRVNEDGGDISPALLELKTLNFTGDGVTVTHSSTDTATVTIAGAAGRTALFTPSSTVGVWTASISSTPLQVTVADIDDYDYITISLWGGEDNTPMSTSTFTFLRSLLTVDTHPRSSESVISMSWTFGSTTRILLFSRNSAGTTIYVSANSSSTDTGKIMGIWGGDF